MILLERLGERLQGETKMSADLRRSLVIDSAQDVAARNQDIANSGDISSALISRLTLSCAFSNVSATSRELTRGTPPSSRSFSSAQSGLGRERHARGFDLIGRGWRLSSLDPTGSSSPVGFVRGAPAATAAYLAAVRSRKRRNPARKQCTASRAEISNLALRSLARSGNAPSTALRNPKPAATFRPRARRLDIDAAPATVLFLEPARHQLHLPQLLRLDLRLDRFGNR